MYISINFNVSSIYINFIYNFSKNKLLTLNKLIKIKLKILLDKFLLLFYSIFGFHKDFEKFTYK